MPDFKTILVVALAIVPGFLGDRLFRLLVGTRWGQGQLEALAQMLCFSLGGLFLYSLGTMYGLPRPIYVFPDHLALIIPESLPSVLAAYGGHCLCSCISAGLFAILVRLRAGLSGVSPYSIVWDHFMRIRVPGRWVVISLQSGETYAGVVDKAEVSVEQKERDVVLAEPALYDETSGAYKALPCSHLFVPGSLIGLVSVSAMDDDLRLVRVDDRLGVDPSAKEQSPNEDKIV